MKAILEGQGCEYVVDMQKVDRYLSIVTVVLLSLFPIYIVDIKIIRVSLDDV